MIPRFDFIKRIDVKKASEWLTNHASDVHAVGLSSRRIAKLINNIVNHHFFGKEKNNNLSNQNGEDELS